MEAVAQHLCLVAGLGPGQRHAPGRAGKSELRTAPEAEVAPLGVTAQQAAVLLRSGL